MKLLWDNLKQKWAAHGVKPNAPTTPKAVEEFETARHVIIPADFKSYLLNVNGMNDELWSTDDDFICFWSLKNLKSLAEDDMCSGSQGIVDAQEYFVFADHSIRVFDLAVRLSQCSAATTPVYFVAGPPRQITANFTEFIERYVAGDEDVIYPHPQ